MLKFHAEPDRNALFWAQEPDPTTDDAFIEAANVAMNSVEDGEVQRGHDTGEG